jgi:GDP-L-fucose synthase
MTYSLTDKRVWVAGHRGMAGSAIVRRLARESCTILTADRAELDLTNQMQTEAWFSKNRPEAVFVAAAKVGGIHANNNYPADFIYDNLAIGLNIVQSAKQYGVEKLLYLGSSCIYPRLAAQPVKESSLLTGPPEPTNEWYAVAKIAAIKLCQAYRRQHGCDYISAIPANLFGPGDNYHPEHSHVPAALIRRFHEAKTSGVAETIIWGTGTPRREFLFVDDMADACLFLMKTYSAEEPVNIGNGTDVSIAEFAQLIRSIVGYKGELKFDLTKPDGMPRRMLDCLPLTAMGWRATTPLEIGLKSAYAWFLENIAVSA